MLAKKLESAAKAVEAAYVEDVFSTYLYTGNGSTQTINNGIDLSGKGGLVWTKGRSYEFNHWLIDTARGNRQVLKSNQANEDQTLTGGLAKTKLVLPLTSAEKKLAEARSRVVVAETLARETLARL